MLRQNGHGPDDASDVMLAASRASIGADPWPFFAHPQGVMARRGNRGKTPGRGPPSPSLRAQRRSERRALTQSITREFRRFLDCQVGAKRPSSASFFAIDGLLWSSSLRGAQRRGSPSGDRTLRRPEDRHAAFSVSRRPGHKTRMKGDAAIAAHGWTG